ncbi:MAG: ABC transporter ATP-binding protein [Alphaproteobacteria bacterium]|nr:ABC transporter ATP-binding protein [Alphaproteobacteria bacterium]
MQPFSKSALKFVYQECIAPFKWAFVGCMLLVLVNSAVMNALNWFMARLIDAVKGGVSEEALHQALLMIGAIIVCDIFNIYLPKQVLMYRQKELYFPVRERILTKSLRYIFGHSTNYIVNKQTGSLLAKSEQISATDQILSVLIVIFWFHLCEMVIKTVLLLSINVYLGLMFIGCVILTAVVNYYANKTSERLSKMENKASSIYTGWLVDAISNIRLVKQFNRADYEKKRLSVLLRQYINIKARSMIAWFASYTGVGCFVHLCSTAMLVYAVYLWSVARINIGDIVFVLMIVNGGFMYLMELCVHFRRFQVNLAGIQAGLEPFNDKHEIEDVPNAKSLKVKKAEVEFKNVTFAYPNREKLFDGFNLKIESGERVGIVGLSGNGKTTLVNLLQRAYDIQGGEILIDGQDIKSVTQQSLHRNLAFIPQESVLFHRTLKENIAYGTENVSDKKIIQAAKTACADAFIRELPEGYNSMVGDRGCKLSGGERQRIAIARAVLRNSPILVLDEATSSLDSESEHIVAQAISNLLGRRTVIAIAHRLSTLKEMDRIVYLEQGKIVEEGTFKALARKKNGKFAKLWKMQQVEK